MVEYSIIIPTLNEADHIERTLEAARAAFGTRAQYLVVDGGSQDATVVLARQARAQTLSAPRGRGLQLHQGTQAAQGSVLILLHADTLLPPDAAAALDQALSNPRVAGGAFSFDFDYGQEQPVALLRVWARVITIRSRVLNTATGDQAIFLRRWALELLGGLPRDPLFEDVRLVRALRKVGKFVILKTTIRTSARLWYQVGPLRLILLHLLLRALHALGVSTERLARWYAFEQTRERERERTRVEG